MTLRLRQVVLAVRDLERAVADIRATFDLAPPFHDPGVATFGLRNAVFALGDTFLEVVSPVRDDAPAARFLARKGGDAGYMAIFQTCDLARDRRRVEQLGVRIVFELALEDIATLHLHPRDLGCAIVSIDEAHPPASWRWAGPGWERKVRSRHGGVVRGVHVAASEAGEAARRWADVLGLGPPTRVSGTGRGGETEGADAGYELALASGRIRFHGARDARAEGIAAIEVEASDRERIVRTACSRGLATDRDEVTLCGARFSLLDPRKPLNT